MNEEVKQALAAANTLRRFCENRPGFIGCIGCPFAASNGYGGTDCSLAQIPETYPHFTLEGGAAVPTDK